MSSQETVQGRVHREVGTMEQTHDSALLFPADGRRILKLKIDIRDFRPSPAFWSGQPRITAALGHMAGPMQGAGPDLVDPPSTRA